MNCRFLTRRLAWMCLAATFGCLAALLCGTAQADLLWYDGFAIGDDDGAGPNYTSASLDGQQGGAGVGIGGVGPGFFDDGAGDPNPWARANNDDPTADDSAPEAGSLSRALQNFPSTGDKVGGGPYVFDCCATSRTSRDFNAPLQSMNGTLYMSFLVNFGNGNPGDPHYRALEFWNGKVVDLVDDGMGGMVPGPSNGRVGDGVLSMSLGVSSFGNFNDAVNQGADPNPNTQLSAKIAGVFEEFGAVETRNFQFEEHVEWAALRNKTQAITLKFDLTTDNKEDGGVGDTVSYFLNPTPDDVVEPTPSLVVSGVDVRADAMSSMILFHFTGFPPNKPNAGFLDELRVGTTWGETAILSVPEPATLSLVGLGAIGLLLSARRKRS